MNLDVGSWFGNSKERMWALTVAESRFMDSAPRSLLAISRELRIANKLKVFELKVVKGHRNGEVVKGHRNGGSSNRNEIGDRALPLGERQTL